MITTLQAPSKLDRAGAVDRTAAAGSAQIAAAKAVASSNGPRSINLVILNSFTRVWLDADAARSPSLGLSCAKLGRSKPVPAARAIGKGAPAAGGLRVSGSVRTRPQAIP